MAVTVALASVLAVAPTTAMANAWDAPVVLTEEAHWFCGSFHDPQPWPEPDNDEGQLVYPIYNRMRAPVHFGIEVHDDDAPMGYVKWQLLNPDGSEFFSAYNFDIARYSANSVDITLPRGNYLQVLTPVGCEGT